MTFEELLGPAFPLLDYPTWPEWQWPGGIRPTLHQPIVMVGGNMATFRIAGTARVDSFCKLEIGAGLLVGRHVHIASFSHVGIGGGLTVLEDGASLGSGAKIISGSNVYGAGRGCSAVAPGAVFERTFVRIRQNAVVFAGAIVLPGVTVGENAVVGAGAVVRRDVPAFEVWAGNPARFIKTIDRGK